MKGNSWFPFSVLSLLPEGEQEKIVSAYCGAMMGKKRWWGLELTRLREDYESQKLSMIQVASKHRTSLGTVARLARKHGWKSRREWTNPQRPTISALKLRKNFLIKRREADQRELDNVEHKINQLVAFGDA